MTSSASILSASDTPDAGENRPVAIHLSGVVYGAMLNDPGELQALGASVSQPPYRAAPQHVVLQVRPRNTLNFVAEGACGTVMVPRGCESVELGISLGIVIGKTACRVSTAAALSHVAGYVAVCELGLAHESHYRPALRFKARDGFTVLGPVCPTAQGVAPGQRTTEISVDGQVRHRGSTAARVRDVATLISEVSEFMTLRPGDVLLLGRDYPAPVGRAGEVITMNIEGLPALSWRMVAQGEHSDPSCGAAPLQISRTFGRVAFGGAIHEAYPHPRGLELDDGRVLREEDVQWLPPIEFGTVLALGLNYADHLRELSKELTVTARDEPLVFLKGPGALVGHRGTTRRPAGVQFMHYECELAVVIGRTAHRVAARDAMDFVAGYTVCNDYAIRDYLENWYRPNLRVKNRDGATAIGPWLVPAHEVPDPQALSIETRVNGAVVQRGSTAQMVNDIAALIEYLSSFMTLLPGDVILTGTPDGVVNVQEGDEVVCEIAGVGRLANTLVGDAGFLRV